MKSPFTQAFTELPGSLPIFPLNNALMLPDGELPLNIFEPRYLNMVRDAMKSEQLIGMVQPTNASTNVSDSNTTQPNLHRIGCAGRIVRYEETLDGRLSIVLKGLCRFEIVQELSTVRGYRLVVPDWSKFEHDFAPTEPDNPQTKLLLHSSLRQYLKHNNIEADWDTITNINLKTLMTLLFNSLPFSDEDKQLLIETSDLSEQLTVFRTILEADIDASEIRH